MMIIVAKGGNSYKKRMENKRVGCKIRNERVILYSVSSEFIFMRKIMKLMMIFPRKETIEKYFKNKLSNCL